MIRIDDVRARIEGKVPALAGQIGNAGEFSKLIEAGQMQAARKAYVLPGALAGGARQAMSGMFTQALEETVLVVLSVRVASDPTGARALDEISPLVRDTVRAVCGWGPEDAPGVFALARGELVGAAQGMLIYQLDFTLDDQLRITP